MGNDPLHPEYGSLIDGGVTTSGVYTQSVIGQTNNGLVAAKIRNDIARIVSTYQGKQVERAKSDKLSYQKTTLTAGEVLASLDDVQMVYKEDTLTVTLIITTAAQSRVSLDLTLQGMFLR